jgi:NAD-dependent deacetylase sirtuin 1
MFDIHYFRKNPRPFFKFAREIYPGQFKPSPCHRFIKCLEKHGSLLRNYTQNIDTLEQVVQIRFQHGMIGSGIYRLHFFQVVGLTRVVQCHGSFARATCMRCKYKVDAEAIKKDIFDQVCTK